MYAKDLTGSSLVRNNDYLYQWISRISSVSRGKFDVTNPEKLFFRLLKESGDKQYPVSRVLEFIPCYIDNTQYIFDSKNKKVSILNIDINYEAFINNILAFSYIDNKGNLYTNYRALYNVLKDTEIVNKFLALDNKLFKVIELKTPMFIFHHYKTHTRLSSIGESDRVIKYKSEYWKPDCLGNLPFIFLRLLCNRREIYSRGKEGFKYKRFIMSGWINDDRTWKHLVLERTNTWTQKETKYVTNLLKKELLL